MSKKIHFTAEQEAEAEARLARFGAGFLGAMKKANELGITDMTKSEAESYLESKGIKVEDVQMKNEETKYIAKSIKIVELYFEKGVYKLEEIFLHAYAKYGDKIDKLFIPVKKAYGSYLIVSDLENATELMIEGKKLTLDIIKEKYSALSKNHPAMEELITQIILGETGLNSEAVRNLKMNYKKMDKILQETAEAMKYPEDIMEWKDSEPIAKLIMQDSRVAELQWYQNKIDQMLGMSGMFQII